MQIIFFAFLNLIFAVFRGFFLRWSMFVVFFISLTFAVVDLFKLLHLMVLSSKTHFFLIDPYLLLSPLLPFFQFTDKRSLLLLKFRSLTRTCFRLKCLQSSCSCITSLRTSRVRIACRFWHLSTQICSSWICNQLMLNMSTFPWQS